MRLAFAFAFALALAGCGDDDFNGNVDHGGTSSDLSASVTDRACNPDAGACAAVDLAPAADLSSAVDSATD